MLKVICDKLGVEIGKRWLANNGTEYQIGEKGELFYKNSANIWVESNDWTPIVIGEIRPVWKPTMKEVYYFPDINYEEESDKYAYSYWTNNKTDNFRLEHRMVFKTRQEAIDRANQILKMIEEGK